MVLLSVLTMALPAQAGLGDLIDTLLDPGKDVPIVGDIVSPVVEGVLHPSITEVVDPTAGALVDPIVDNVVAPVVETVVSPGVEEALVPVVGDGAPPIVEEVLPPIQGTDPIPGTTTPTVPLLGSAAPTDGVSRPLGVSASSDVAQSWYSNRTVARGSAPDTVAIKGVATEVQSLKVASALQTALVASGAPLIPISANEPLPVRTVSDFRLDGLTNWLRTDGLGNLLALPIRLLDLLARALLTAGSGLVAPLSMLLALTAYLIKDRHWVVRPPATTGKIWRRRVGIARALRSLSDKGRSVPAKLGWSVVVARFQGRQVGRTRSGSASPTFRSLPAQMSP